MAENTTGYIAFIKEQNPQAPIFTGNLVAYVTDDTPQGGYEVILKSSENIPFILGTRVTINSELIKEHNQKKEQCSIHHKIPPNGYTVHTDEPADNRFDWSSKGLEQGELDFSKNAFLFSANKAPHTGLALTIEDNARNTYANQPNHYVSIDDKNSGKTLNIFRPNIEIYWKARDWDVRELKEGAFKGPLRTPELQTLIEYVTGKKLWREEFWRK